MRIGFGYDVHRFTEGRPLILGGITIPYEKGLLGHSDADVLVHAIMDGILGALALGDIGLHFPDTDPAYKNADSMILLAKVRELIAERGYIVGNIDSVLSAEQPKLRPYIDAMRGNLAACLGIGMDQVSVKATTEEGLGFTGRKEGIKCETVVLLINQGV